MTSAQGARRLHAIARIGRTADVGPGRMPLAGSAHVWFDADAAEMAQSDRRRLSTLRADICGLRLDQPRVMGILNVTPDSFSDGGDYRQITSAVERARVMAAEADILDIGGESTRPGADFVPEDEEIKRTAPVIRAIRESGITTPISIDTRKAKVAHAALEAGADMVNDVTALRHDPEMAAVVASHDVPVCLMHSRGTPETMAQLTDYDDLLAEVYDHLAERIDAAKAAGIRAERLIVDPGIGFGKTLQHNLTLLRGLSLYHDLGAPILLGASRKRFIGTIGAADQAKDRLGGSLAVALQGAMQGAQILRVHDTFETRQALRLHLAIQQDE